MMADASGVFYRATVDPVPTQFSDQFFNLLSNKEQRQRHRPSTWT